MFNGVRLDLARRIQHLGCIIWIVVLPVGPAIPVASRVSLAMLDWILVTAPMAMGSDDECENIETATQAGLQTAWK